MTVYSTAPDMLPNPKHLVELTVLISSFIIIKYMYVIMLNMC